MNKYAHIVFEVRNSSNTHNGIRHILTEYRMSWATSSPTWLKVFPLQISTTRTGNMVMTYATFLYKTRMIGMGLSSGKLG